MALTQEEQFERLVLRSNRILILLPEHPTGDHIGAGWGLSHFLSSYGADVTVAYTDPHNQASAYHFLTKPTKIVSTLSGTRDFVLTFKTAHNNITNVHHERTDDTLSIFVTPERGMIDSHDFSFGLADFSFDLLITLGASSRQSLGTLSTDVPDIFYDIPLINIDQNIANESYGQLNILTFTASCVTEIVAKLCIAMDETHVSEDAVSCFLTGLISATNSFRESRTTPHTLSLASDLIDRGANQQEIVTHLYKSQPLGLIKLWGRALTNLTKTNGSNIISTTISHADFSATDTQIYVVAQILDKVKNNYSDGKIFVIIYEDAETYCALIDATRFGTLPRDIYGEPSEKNLYTLPISQKSLKRAQEFVIKKLNETAAQS